MNYSEQDVRALVESIVKSVQSAKASDEIPVGISNRHIHLSREHVEILFGKGYELTKCKDLSQPGQYACKETLTIVGPSMRAIEGVRVLGPERKSSQVEISRTDSFTLKVKPPVRESGKIQGSARIPYRTGSPRVHGKGGYDGWRFPRGSRRTPWQIARF